MNLIVGVAARLGLVCGLLAGHIITADAQDDVAGQGYASLKGKKVIYIPIAMNYSLTQAWYAGMKREADRFGYEIIVRDPNWDANAAVQAFQAAIREKPDLIVTLPTDTTSISRLVTKAGQEGIPVIEVQQMTSTAPDVYVGADYLSIGRMNASAVVEACGKSSGKSGKVAIVSGVVTAPASISWEQGIKEVFSGHEDIKVISTQAADWDASKSHSIVATALQQNPDLCAVLDVWDGQATGSAAAVREARKTGQVFVATAGGGEGAACEAIKTGAFSSYVSFDAAAQTRYLNALAKYVLQSKLAPGSSRSIVYTPDKVLTKDGLGADSCWTLKQMEASGG